MRHKLSTAHMSMDRWARSLRSRAPVLQLAGLCTLIACGYLLGTQLTKDKYVPPLRHLTEHVPYGYEVDFQQLSTVGCRQTEALRVCSHQANAHELHIVNGSLGAYFALWDHGIRCFDIDFMRTREGFVVATHPQRLQDAIGTAIGDVRKTLSNNTIIMIRSLGAADEDFPITDALFELFSKLIRDTEDKPWLESKTQPNYRSAPMMVLDLKGDTFTKDMIWAVMKHAEKHGVTDYLALAGMWEEQDQVLQNSGVWWGPKIRGFADTIMHPNGTAEANTVDISTFNLTAYSMLAPSIKMNRTFFVDAKATGKPIHSWVVDSPQELFYALEMQLDSVISNVPLRLQTLLEEWRRGCRIRFPRQAHWRPDD